MIKDNKRKITYICIALALSFLWNSLSYWGGRLIAQNFHHFDLTLPIDLVIPIIPVSIIIYFGSYLIWFINYAIIAQGDGAGRFFAADFWSRVICLIFFVLMPTTLVRPDITGNSPWETLMVFLYQMDSPDNLFPSIHCLVSWLCFIGIRRRKDIAGWYKVLTLILALLICISTITTGQHVILDIIAGIVLAEFSYWAAGFKKVSCGYTGLLDRLTDKLSEKI